VELAPSGTGRGGGTGVATARLYEVWWALAGETRRMDRHHVLGDRFLRKIRGFAAGSSWAARMYARGARADDLGLVQPILGRRGRWFFRVSDEYVGAGRTSHRRALAAREMNRETPDQDVIELFGHNCEISCSAGVNWLAWQDRRGRAGPAFRRGRGDQVGVGCGPADGAIESGRNGTTTSGLLSRGIGGDMRSVGLWRLAAGRCGGPKPDLRPACSDRSGARSHR